MAPQQRRLPRRRCTRGLDGKDHGLESNAPAWTTGRESSRSGTIVKEALQKKIWKLSLHSPLGLGQATGV